MDRLDQMIALADQYGVRIRYKDQSDWMVLLGKLMWFNPRFMSHFTTVIQDTIWFPSEKFMWENRDRSAVTIAHELQHVVDRRAVGDLVFTIQYLSPQIQSLGVLLALGGFVFPPLFLMVLSIVWVLPFRAPMRAHYEERGYRMSLSCAHWLGWDTKSYLTSIMPNFEGPQYYWMARSVSKPIRKRLELHIEELRKGTVELDDLASKVCDIMLSKTIV